LIIRIFEGIYYLEPFSQFFPFCHGTGLYHLFSEFDRELLEVKVSQQFLNSLCTYSGSKRISVFGSALPVSFLAQQLTFRQRSITRRPKVATSRTWITSALRERSMPTSSRWIIGLLNMDLFFSGSGDRTVFLGDGHKSILQVCLKFPKLGDRNRGLDQVLDNLVHLLLGEVGPEPQQ